MTTRLSRKAQEEADRLSAHLGLLIRNMASAMAEGKEFADVDDVKQAYEAVILACSAGIEGARNSQ